MNQHITRNPLNAVWMRIAALSSLVLCWNCDAFCTWSDVEGELVESETDWKWPPLGSSISLITLRFNSVSSTPLSISTECFLRCQILPVLPDLCMIKPVWDHISFSVNQILQFYGTRPTTTVSSQQGFNTGQCANNPPLMLQSLKLFMQTWTKCKYYLYQCRDKFE